MIFERTKMLSGARHIKREPSLHQMLYVCILEEKYYSARSYKSLAYVGIWTRINGNPTRREKCQKIQRLTLGSIFEWLKSNKRVTKYHWWQKSHRLIWNAFLPCFFSCFFVALLCLSKVCLPICQHFTVLS